MAEIRPFKGLRYTKKAGDITELVCPPYDIISPAQREEYIKENPYNVIRLELPAGENPYEEAKKILEEWMAEEILKTDMDEGLYIYELGFRENVETGRENSLKGLICRVRLEEFENNVVLPHEETLSKAKEDRFNLMKATGCNFSQIYSLYPDESHVTRERMDNLTSSQTPRYDFSDGLVNHKLWVINDPVTIAAVCGDFKERKLYIADGHHRYETALNYRNYCRENNIYSPGSDYIMMFLADMTDPGLVVFPTHRLVRGLEGFDGDKILEACAEYFDVKPLDTAEEIDPAMENADGHVFGYCDGSRAALLTLKDPSVMAGFLPDMSEDYRMLDVSVLHNLILEKLLGIDKENMANQKNLTYTRSFDEAVESVKSGESNCAFFLCPTKVSEIAAVAANGEKMPQKSTYFYPKMITGLVMRVI